MLQWKGGYDDGRLGRWTQADLAEYMLDYFPRKVSVDEETLTAVPECVRAFLGFLDARGSLSGEPLEQLEHACEELREEFQAQAHDSSHWGLAKSMVMQMQIEGIDPSAAGALDAWMADFNARPREQRDAIIGPVADRMVPAPRRRSARSQAQDAAPQGATPSPQAQPPGLTLSPPGCRLPPRHPASVGCSQFQRGTAYPTDRPDHRFALTPTRGDPDASLETRSRP